MRQTSAAAVLAVAVFRAGAFFVAGIAAFLLATGFLTPAAVFFVCTFFAAAVAFVAPVFVAADFFVTTFFAALLLPAAPLFPAGFALLAAPASATTLASSIKNFVRSFTSLIRTGASLVVLQISISGDTSYACCE
jgi:hypothetical protein